jgi:dihydrofolate synthase/folylpolyglutamate synthase
MTYQQTLDYLFSQLPMFQRVGKAAYKANLDNTLALDEYFNHPHRKFRTIHIAGTNGKGSTSHMLASILASAGLKVGLYTSPHLRDFRERIKINGVMIPEMEVVGFVEKHRAFFDTIKPSFFEMTVALAFDYFARQQIDIAVVEVGLGGRLDSTNIITPEVSIITNIGLDHTDLLGHTLEKIAYEKAGIIKPNVPVVVSQTQAETKPVFEQKAKECNTPIVFADTRYGTTPIGYEGYKYQILNICRYNPESIVPLKLDLLGSYQQYNICGVLTAIDLLREKGYCISDAHVKDGLVTVKSATGLLGRWQVLHQNPLIICDTGHNVDGLTQVVEQIRRVQYKKLHMVVGMVGDKNIDGMLALLPREATYYFTRASIPRALNENELAARATPFGLSGETYPTVFTALNAAKANAHPNDLVFIGGSTFVVAEVV